MKNSCVFTPIKILIYTITLVIAASFSHFAYNLSGQNIIVGLFNPVHESLWEHLKLMFFPFLLWWIILFLIKNKKCEISFNTWIVSAAVSLIAAPFSVVLLFYGYTGALGIESAIIDILLTVVCYFIALCVASHFLKYSKPNQCAVMISVIIIAVTFIAFVVFTLNPPQLPIFLVQ